MLQYSMFDKVYFPPKKDNQGNTGTKLSLRKSISFSPHGNIFLEQIPLVVFDLETTGLSAKDDWIVEIGAQKIVQGKVVGTFDTLIDPKCEIPLAAQKVSGITNEMLVGKPEISTVLPKFFQFIQGCILVAHNATFDIGFIKHHASLLGFDFTWPVFCTLKLARELLPNLERKNLDTLAEHYGLTFEARHRSIGDVKVTASVLEELLRNEGSHLEQWKDFAPYTVN